MTILAIMAVLVLLAWFLYDQNNHLTTTTIVLSADVSNEVRIVHLSDTHSKFFGPHNEKLYRHITQLGPDIIVHTGDVLSEWNVAAQKYADTLDGLSKLAPVYAIPGNHEYRYSDEWPQYRETLRRKGLHVLEDDVAIASVGAQRISILGVSFDAQKRELGADVDDADTRRAFSRFERLDGYKLVLDHCPMSFYDNIKYPFDLQLSGHAHGGQFRLPFIGGLYSPDQGLFPKVTSGLYEEDGHYLIVSRGLGNSGFPQRLFNRPEVILIRLVPKAA